MQKPILTIIVPVYNEGRTIEEIMRRTASAHPHAEIVYVDDGSRDTSLACMKSHARPQDKILTKENGGKGSAIRHGIPHATGKFTVIQDADLEYDPQEIHTLLREAEKNPGAAIFGSRFLVKNPNLYKRYLLGNKIVTMILNLLFHGNLTDSYTCYKLFPTEILQSLQLCSNGFEIEAEFCAKLFRAHIQILEVPIRYSPRSLAEGKKIRFSDAWKGVATMLRVRCCR